MEKKAGANDKEWNDIAGTFNTEEMNEEKAHNKCMVSDLEIEKSSNCNNISNENQEIIKGKNPEILPSLCSKNMKFNEIFSLINPSWWTVPNAVSSKKKRNHALSSTETQPSGKNIILKKMKYNKWIKDLKGNQSNSYLKNKDELTIIKGLSQKKIARFIPVSQNQLILKRIKTAIENKQQAPYNSVLSSTWLNYKKADNLPENMWVKCAKMETKNNYFQSKKNEINNWVFMINNLDAWDDLSSPACNKQNDSYTKIKSIKMLNANKITTTPTTPCPRPCRNGLKDITQRLNNTNISMLNKDIDLTFNDNNKPKKSFKNEIYNKELNSFSKKLDNCSGLNLRSGKEMTSTARIRVTCLFNW